MFASTLLLAASSIFSLALGAPIVPLSRRAAQQYSVFGGDGSMMQGWPAKNQWLEFEPLWELNRPMLYRSCAQFSASGITNPNNNEDEVRAIKAALLKIAGESGLPPQFLLAIMMQESKGCVRAPTTNYGHDNPGLFQSFEGTASCNRNINALVTPCPASTIEAMVREGAGINRPFGLLQAIQQSGASDDSKWYKAARIYNSGHIAASGNLGDGIATHCYASDIANRLVGWPNDDKYQSVCDEGRIQGAAGGNGAYAGAIQSNNPTPKPQPQTPGKPIDLPTDSKPTGPKEGTIESPKDKAPVTPPKAEPPKGQVPDTTTPKKEPDAPKIAGAAANCRKWYTVKAGDNCSVLPVEFAKLRQLNTGLDADCSNLWLGYAYCVGA